MGWLALGLFLIVAAVGVVLFVAFAPRPAPADDPLADAAGDAGSGRYLTGDRIAAARARLDSATRGSGSPFSVDRLELAGITARPSSVLLGVVLTVLGAGAVGVVLAALRPGVTSWILPLLAMIVAAIVLRLLYGRRVAKRRARFADQLEGTLQLVAGSLRAGHSLPRAVEAVAADSESPTREEFARVINQHRLGRDLDDALMLAARRMESPDLEWTAEAVAVHREVGGNLGEVLDHVAATIRERQQLRRQVASLSAEGRVSALVLMALPILVAIALLVVAPGYLSMFVTSPLGLGLLIVSLVLFGLGATWLRAITRVRF